MAGDWIKMRKSLPTDGRIVRMMSALNADRLRTLGGLLSAWCLLDEHTETGKLDGYTPAAFDEIIGFPGLAAAMEKVGWLEIGDGFLQAPDFERHNGATAKRRAQESVRKMSARNADKCPHPKQTKCAPEKRREKNNKEVGNAAVADSCPHLDSSPKPKGRASSIEEVKAYAASISATPTEAEDFWDKMEAGGWMRGKVKIADWQSHFRSFKRNGWLASSPAKQQTSGKTRSFSKS